MRKIIFKFSLILVLIQFASCISPKKVIYFQEKEGVELNEEVINYEPKIQVGDMLNIIVTSLDGEASLPFNLYETPVGTGNITNAKPIYYKVDSEGKIVFPILGEQKVTELTTKELRKSLTEQISSYVKNPTVTIYIKNFKISVLGAVKNPGIFPVENERISIVEAIGMAGDLNIQGKRKNVLLIREKDGKRTTVNIDLTSRELFSSPYYYLSQNDVIYVEPNNTQIQSSVIGPNVTIIFTTISFFLSFYALFIK